MNMIINNKYETLISHPHKSLLSRELSVKYIKHRHTCIVPIQGL